MRRAADRAGELAPVGPGPSHRLSLVAADGPSAAAAPARAGTGHVRSGAPRNNKRGLHRGAATMATVTTGPLTV
jgi:hypothetical protein